MLNFIQSLSLAPQVRIQNLAHRMREENGQTFVEYALLIGGLSITLLASFLALQGAFDDVITKVRTALGV